MRLLETVAACAVICVVATVHARDAAVPTTWRLQAREVAVGLSGVAGVRQVGRFHAGGPIPGNPEFLLQTNPGRVLDRQRLLVAVASNFGAPLGSAADRPGAILSIDPRGARTLVVPAVVATAGGQAHMPGAAVQLYSAQSPGFLNRRFNGGAGPLLTDHAFHNTGVPPSDRAQPDGGRVDGIRRLLQDEFNCLGRYSDAKREVTVSSAA